MEKYVDFGNEGCPVLLDDDFYVLLDLIDVGCPMTDPETWQYPGLKPDSASRGMIIGKFSFGKGGFEEFYRSVFTDLDDIVDVKGASIAHQRTVQPADAAAAGWQNPDTAAYPGRIWIFGGRDLAGYRGDLWAGSPFVTQEGEIVFSWQRAITQANGPAPSQAPQPRQATARCAGTSMHGTRSRAAWSATASRGSSSATRRSLQRRRLRQGRSAGSTR